MAQESVSVLLVQGALERYIDNFAGVSVEQFKKLLMQDYGKFGVTSVEDKQKLFRLIKRVNKSEPAGILQQLHVDEANRALSQLELREARLDGNAAMIDLEDDFMDEERHAEGILELSPAQHAAPPARPRSALPAAGALPPPPRVGDNLEKIKVVVRKRPLNSKEREKGEDDIVPVDNRSSSLMVDEPKVKVDLTKYTERHCFVFDCVLDESVDNDTVYQKTVRPLVETIFHHGKSTVFAYGQTGSGKTFTMQPLPIQAAADILRIMQRPEFHDCDLWVASFEIYGGKVFDLLNGRQRLVMREDGKKNVCVVGLQEHCVPDVRMVQDLIEHGNAARSTGSTGANDTSSRSHAIMQFSLKRRKADGTPGGKLMGKLSFIDLAGSERGADTYDNDKQTRIEGAEINKSLLALKECIRALDNDARHIPFRGSKLTEVLRDSFIGEQARTVMIANISPGAQSCEHTLNTLRYADRVKELRKERWDRNPSQVTPGLAPLQGNIQLPYQPKPAREPSPLNQRIAGVDARHQPFVPGRGAGAGAGGGPSTSDGPRQPSAPRARPITPRESNGGGAAGARAGGAPLPRVGSRAAGGVPRPAVGAGAAQRGAAKTPTSELESSPGDSGRDYGRSDEGSEGDISDYDAQREEGQSLLEEEDQLIAAHRLHIEETMDAVRKEMALLSEVDQPGSAIDSYVDRLGRILEYKARGLIELQEKLVQFKGRLIKEQRAGRGAAKAMR